MGGATGIYVAGNYAYVVVYFYVLSSGVHSSIQIIDIANPTTPTLAGSYERSCQ